jgi:hypothetical protein
MKGIVSACALILFLTTACTTVSVARGTIATQAAQCEPAGQDAFVYSPDRLEVLSPCLHVSGIVKDLIVNPFDGDAVMGLEPDEASAVYLTATNRVALGGTLHIEVICYMDSMIMSPKAKAACSSYPSSMQILLPQVGQHVWLEGRWVLDHSHGGWAELHPLYRWGLAQ